MALWDGVDENARIKHVEPLGDLSSTQRLFRTQAALRELHGDRVTVLAMGELALPFRAVLAENNDLDYVALSDAWRSAPGQRLLQDARRTRDARDKTSRRLGILGSRIASSRSPRIHPQPFDRLELPDDTDVVALLPQLHPHYAGFAVTSPFKRTAARAVGADMPAVNTLVRLRNGWKGANTDVEGARVALRKLPDGPLTVLGNGGAADAIRAAFPERDIRVVRRAEVGVVSGVVVWTWPAHVAPPDGLRFDHATVGVIAYGPPAWSIAADVRARGGTPRMLGPAWFVAQARAQRRLWSEAA
ncbi:MAG: shikimate dehydrogenase [Myxococcota bacterium]